MPRQTLEWRVPFDLATRHETCENGYGQKQCKTPQKRGGNLEGKQPGQIDGPASSSSSPGQARPGQPTCLPFIMNAAWQRQQLETRAKQDVHSTAHTHTHTHRARHVHVCRHSIMLASSAVSLSHFICLGLRPRTCNLLIKYRMSFKQWWRLQRVVACGGRGHDTLYHKSQLKMPFKLSLYTVYCHVAGTVSVSASLSSLLLLLSLPDSISNCHFV